MGTNYFLAYHGFPQSNKANARGVDFSVHDHIHILSNILFTMIQPFNTT